MSIYRCPVPPFLGFQNVTLSRCPGQKAWKISSKSLRSSCWICRPWASIALPRVTRWWNGSKHFGNFHLDPWGCRIQSDRSYFFKWAGKKNHPTRWSWAIPALRRALCGSDGRFANFGAGDKLVLAFEEPRPLLEFPQDFMRHGEVPSVHLHNDVQHWHGAVHVLSASESPAKHPEVPQHILQQHGALDHADRRCCGSFRGRHAFHPLHVGVLSSSSMVARSAPPTCKYRVPAVKLQAFRIWFWPCLFGQGSLAVLAGSGCY